MGVELFVHVTAGMIGGIATTVLDRGRSLGPAFWGWLLGIATTIAATTIVKFIQ